MYPHAYPAVRDTEPYDRFFGLIYDLWAQKAFIDTYNIQNSVDEVYANFYANSDYSGGATHVPSTYGTVTMAYNNNGQQFGIYVQSGTNHNPTTMQLHVPFFKRTAMPEDGTLAAWRITGDYSELTNFFQPLTVQDVLIAIERFTHRVHRMHRHVQQRPEDSVPFPLGGVF